MSHLLDEEYLTWLYGQVGSVKSRLQTRTYWSLLRQLYTHEFVWIIANDDNRVEDGRDLRHEFAESHRNVAVDRNWLELDCSVLEMLIGLSRRLSFEAEGEPRDWFWHLMKNLELSTLTDHVYDERIYKRVDVILENLVSRRYQADGLGGLFPLLHPDEDQRRVEIWDQLNLYLLERIS